MGAVRLALPAALALWFIWQARRRPLFLLGIPVLMATGGSVFFQNAKPFWMPGRLSQVTLIMIWLTIVWGITIMRRSGPDGEGAPVGPFGPARVLPEELLLMAIAALVAVHTFSAFSASGDLMGAMTLAAATIYSLVGYLFLRGILSRASRAETKQFLAAVVVVNTGACALYILDQGLHIPIYLGAANITYVFQGQSIARGTVYQPVFNVLALGFVLAKRRWTPFWLAVLGITLEAIIVSLTRTMLIAAVAGLVVAVVARELVHPDFTRIARRTGATVFAAVAVVVVFSRVVPTYWDYMLKRLDEFISPKNGQVENWQVRVIHWDAVQHVVAKIDMVFGLGFPQPGSNAVDSHIWLWSSDMAWLPIMYRFGYVGLVLFALLIGCFMARALAVSFKPPEMRRELALAYFVVLTLTFIMSFENWVFMNPDVFPVGLLVFALITVEALRPSELPETAAAPLPPPSLTQASHRAGP